MFKYLKKKVLNFLLILISYDLRLLDAPPDQFNYSEQCSFLAPIAYKASAAIMFYGFNPYRGVKIYSL